MIEYKRAGGRDFLGIETLSEAILSDLLPGINSILSCSCPKTPTAASTKPLPPPRVRAQRGIRP
jgi:hypothetical protein